LARGVDQLSDWVVITDSDQPRLHLRCTNDVAAQIERRFGSLLGSRMPIRAQDQGEWTHRYPLGRQLTEEEAGFLELLTRVLTLRLGPPVTVAIALDYYKDPSSAENPQLWANTRVGELVHQGKYAGADRAGRALAMELSQFMDRHPDLRIAEAVVSVPSHSARRFSERLAGVVGRLRGIPLIELRDDTTEQMKDTDPSSRPKSKLSIKNEAVAGKAVVVIDDVVRTGESLRSVAAFLKASGAREVSALVAVRTMRN
jgi:hypothetical protein